MKDYKTVSHDGCDEFVEKKSKFIGYCRRVSTVQEAQAFIEEISSMHRQARHNAYAYVLRGDNIERFSDAGEPAGTAGVPILEAIKGEGLCDVAVVVTRYFGGILLGTGPLARAYGKAGSMGIAASGMCNMVYCDTLCVRCNYTAYGKIEYIIKNTDAVLKNSIFENDVALSLAIPQRYTDSFIAQIADASGGTAVIERIASEYTEQLI